jgi:hypothetical protein
MKTTSILASLVAAMALSSVVEAKTVLSAKERCFWVGNPLLAGSGTFLKIKPEQALTDKRGAIVEIVGLQRNSAVVYPPISDHYIQFTGAGSFISSSGGGEFPHDIVQIALIGTRYGRADLFPPTEIKGVSTLSYTLMLEPEKKGKIPGGRLVGQKSFKPTEAGHKDDPEENSVIDEPVNEISCKDF